MRRPNQRRIMASSYATLLFHSCKARSSNEPKELQTAPTPLHLLSSSPSTIRGGGLSTVFSTFLQTGRPPLEAVIQSTNPHATLAQTSHANFSLLLSVTCGWVSSRKPQDNMQNALLHGPGGVDEEVELRLTTLQRKSLWLERLR